MADAGATEEQKADVEVPVDEEEQRRQQLQAKLDQFCGALWQGMEVMKQPRRGKPHKRVLWLSPDKLVLYCGQSKGAHDAKIVTLSEVREVSPIEGRDGWMIIVTPTLQLRVGFGNDQTRNFFVRRFRALLAVDEATI